MCKNLVPRRFGAGLRPKDGPVGQNPPGGLTNISRFRPGATSGLQMDVGFFTFSEMWNMILHRGHTPYSPRNTKFFEVALFSDISIFSEKCWTWCS